MTQETPQSTRPRSWLVIVGLVILAIIVAFAVAQLGCPKPNPGKPVPAAAPMSENFPTVPAAPPPSLADGPQK